MKNLFKKSKNNQKFIFCIFTPKENTEALIKKYKYLISECINRYGRFTIFVFKKKQKIFTIQSFPKNKVDKVDIIYIDKKHDFLDYINNKTLFAIDEISRDLRYFNIRRLINKENIKLIYIMNIGFIPNTTYSQNKEISFKNATAQDESKSKFWDPIPRNLEKKSIQKANEHNYKYQRN